MAARESRRLNRTKYNSSFLDEEGKSELHDVCLPGDHTEVDVFRFDEERKLWSQIFCCCVDSSGTVEFES